MCHFLSHEWWPRTQPWPPGAQSTAGGTALLRIILEAETRLGCCSPDSWLLPRPKESTSGDRFLTQGLYRNKRAGTSLCPFLQEGRKAPASQAGLFPLEQCVRTSRLAQLPECLLQVLARSLLALEPHGQEVKGLTPTLVLLPRPSLPGTVQLALAPTLALAALPPSCHQGSHRGRALDLMVTKAD